MICALMGCKRPLLAVTGACALSMTGVLAFATRVSYTHGSRHVDIVPKFSSFVSSSDLGPSLSLHTQRRCLARMTTRMSTGGDGESQSERKKVVFLGTPDVAAISLELLLQASREGGEGRGLFEIVRAVSNRPARSGRQQIMRRCPVHTLAETEGIPVMTPSTARDETFLAELEALQPDLCVTAAYGQFLPQRFLDIPKFGTLNVHPSLLPRYRGASPVQRCLEAGEAETGVTVAFTVLKMDAGPIVRQRVRPLDGSEKAPELLRELFREGTRDLIDCLPSVFDGTVKKTPQDDTAAIKAAKISVNEARCCFKTSSSRTIHNKVRAFAGWPGTWAMFTWGEGDKAVPQKVKLVTTELGKPMTSPMGYEVVFRRDALELTCGDGSVVRVLEVQPTNKNVMGAKAFANGLRGASMSWVELNAVEEAVATRHEQE